MFFSQSENFAYCDKSELIEPIHFEYYGAIFKLNLRMFKKDL